MSWAEEEKRRVSVGASGYRNIEYQMCTPTTHPKAEPPAATQDAPQVCEPHLLRSQNGGLNQVTSRGAKVIFPHPLPTDPPHPPTRLHQQMK